MLLGDVFIVVYITVFVQLSVKVSLWWKPSLETHVYNSYYYPYPWVSDDGENRRNTRTKKQFYFQICDNASVLHFYTMNTYVIWYIYIYIYIVLSKQNYYVNSLRLDDLWWLMNEI